MKDSEDPRDLYDNAMQDNDIHLFFPFGGVKDIHDAFVQLYDVRQKHPALSLYLNECLRTLIEQVTTFDKAWCDTIDTSAGLIELSKSRHSSLVGFFHTVYQISQYLIHVGDRHAQVAQSASKHGVSGLCLGIPAACVIAGSANVSDIIYYGVQGAKLLLHIGHRLDEVAMQYSSISPDADRISFSMVVMAPLDTVQKHIDEFNETSGQQRIYVSIVVDSSSTSVTGPPTVLAQFNRQCKQRGIRTVYLPVRALWHGLVNEQGKKKVVQDAAIANVILPSKLRLTVRSSATGKPIHPQSSNELIETLADLIMCQPVRMDLVMKSVADSHRHMRILNFGPGNGSVDKFRLHIPQADIIQMFPTDGPCLSALVPPEASPCASPAEEEIAIIGMGCRFPGNSNTPEQFWNVLKNGIETIQEIPDTRFKLSDYYHPDGSVKNKMHSRYGHFVDADLFDHQFFNVSPREAANTDPQHRVFLHVAYEALEHAGYNEKGSFDPSRFGCYVGIASDDYRQNMTSDIDAFYCPGGIRGFSAGKVSYFFRWTGPSITYDTACASSMTAIHYACQALKAGECDAALAGGVSLLTSPEMFIGLSRGHFISNTGGCKTFDQEGDGYCRADGVGAIVLKKLSDALRDNDNILGVIAAHGANHSGNADSITRPHAPTQEKLFREVCNKAGCDPSDVGVVECHAAGTQAGDVAEVEAVVKAYGSNRKADNPLYVSSCKPIVGHSEAAAGVSSLMKALLMIKHQELPAHRGIRTTMNSRILNPDFLVVPRATTPFPKGRVVSVNNFGAPGANTNVIIRGHDEGRSRVDSRRSHHVLTFTAKSAAALTRSINNHVQYLASNPGRLQDVSYTLACRRLHHPYRLAVYGSDSSDVIKNLRKVQVPLIPTGANDAPELVFCFSGQGAGYAGMARELYATCEVFRSTLKQCNDVLLSFGDAGFLTSLLDGDESIAERQLATFSIGYSISKMLQSWGIKPAAVFGHSLGEYIAATIAGMVSLEDTLWLLSHRVQLMLARLEPGTAGMLAINSGVQHVEKLISRLKLDLEIACINSPNDIVVAGSKDLLSQLKSHLDCKSTLLDVPFAFHSSQMGKILDEYAEIAKKVTFRKAKIPFIGNVSGNVYSMLDAEYLCNQTRNRVNFTKCIETVCDMIPDPIFIDIGPHPISMPLIKACVDVPVVSTLHKKKNNWESISQCVSDLYNHGVNIDFMHYHKGEDSQVVELPLYPFQYTSHWIAYQDRNVVMSASMSPREDSLPWQFSRSTKDGYEVNFQDPNLQALVSSHRVDNIGVACAAIFADIAMASLDSLDAKVVRNLALFAPITESTGLVLCRQQSKNITFEKDGALIASCEVHDRESSCSPLLEDMVSERAASMASSQLNYVAKNWIYRMFKHLGVEYGNTFSVVESIKTSDDNKEAYAILKKSDASLQFSVDPIILDSVVQVAGFLACSNIADDDMCVVSQIREIDIQNLNTSYAVYARMSSGGDCPSIDAFLLADGKIIGRVFGIQFAKMRKETWHQKLQLAVQAKTITKTKQSTMIKTTTTTMPSSVPVQTYIHDRPTLEAALEILKPFELADEPNTLTARVDKVDWDTRTPSEHEHKTSPKVDWDSKTPPLRSLSLTSTLNGSDSDAISIIKAVLADELGMDPTEIQGDSNFRDLGVDSIMTLEMIAKLPKHIGANVAMFYTSSSLNELEQRFAEA